MVIICCTTMFFINSFSLHSHLWQPLVNNVLFFSAKNLLIIFMTYSIISKAFILYSAHFNMIQFSSLKVPLAANWKGVCLQNISKSHSYHLEIW